MTKRNPINEQIRKIKRIIHYSDSKKIDLLEFFLLRDTPILSITSSKNEDDEYFSSHSLTLFNRKIVDMLFRYCSYEKIFNAVDIACEQLSKDSSNIFRHKNSVEFLKSFGKYCPEEIALMIELNTEVPL